MLVALEGIILSEISQTKADKYFMISLVKSKMQKKTKLITKEIRLAVARGWVWWEGELDKYGQKVHIYHYTRVRGM